MDFRLTYSGPLLAHRDGQKLAERSLHVHEIRRTFHRQLSLLWKSHPVLSADRYPELGEDVRGHVPLRRRHIDRPAIKAEGFEDAAQRTDRALIAIEFRRRGRALVLGELRLQPLKLKGQHRGAPDQCSLRGGSSLLPANVGEVLKVEVPKPAHRSGAVVHVGK